MFLLFVLLFSFLCFYWSSSVAGAIDLGAGGIVPVVCSIVLSATHVRPCESRHNLMDKHPSQGEGGREEEAVLLVTSCYRPIQWKE